MKGAIGIGIVLLIVSIVAARWALGPTFGTPKADKPAVDATKPPDYVVCWGYFDSERGVTILFPKQSGDIVSVVPENTHVTKGTVLLQIDDTAAKLQVSLAEADANAAERQYEEAKLLTEQYSLQRIQQEASIRSLESETKKIALERDSKVLSLDPGQPIRKTLEQMYAEGLKQLAEKKIAEQAKLKQLELLDAKYKIDQAMADWVAKKTRLKLANEMLKHYQLVAPGDGTVLRVHVRRGETWGPNPRPQAIDFLEDGPVIVRAEVLQEWGRFVNKGQDVVIEDDTYSGPKWDGKVTKILGWYAPTRTPVIEPFRYNDVRTLECIIDVTSGDAKKLNGQRIRAKIKI